MRYDVGIGTSRTQSHAVARTQKQAGDETEIVEKNKRGTFASANRFKRSEARSVYTDEELRQWFADDPTTDLRTHLRRTMQTLIAMGIIKPDVPMPGYRRLAEITGLYPSLFQHTYRELQELGIIRAEHGRAFFANDPLPARLALTADILARAIHQARYIGLDEANIGAVFKAQLARAKSRDVSRRKP
jgi:DNA-binding transcriptional regulator YhcF (GntR family)